MGKLTVAGAKAKGPGRHADGDGLYLLVKESGARSWMLRVQSAGTRRDVGLGGFSDLTLAEAREKAAGLRKLARSGADPVTERDKDRRPTPTFKEAAKLCHAEMSRGWGKPHAATFLSSLQIHVFPKLGAKRVDHIDAGAIRDALAPVWTVKPVTARNLRQRIGMVLNFAHSKGWRPTEAPGKAVTMGLAKQARAGHFEAMPYRAVPALLTTLSDRVETMGRLALAFTALTAARSNEVRGTKWSHFDFDTKLWTRPASLMKTRIEHAVTLNDEALAILRRAEALRTSKSDSLVFPGRDGGVMSESTLLKCLQDNGGAGTVHGLRSAFRDWAAELMPTIPGEVAEAALSHSVGDATERAYRRTNFLEMRRKLLAAWGNYTAGKSNVVRLAAG